EVGLTDRIGMRLGSLHELDLVTGGQCHHGLLPPAPPAFEATHALPLALAGGRSNGGHLDAEDLLHRLANLHFVGARRDREGHHVEIFLLLHALLGHERANQHRPGILHDLSASSRASNAACSKTTQPVGMTLYTDGGGGVAPASQGTWRAASTSMGLRSDTTSSVGAGSIPRARSRVVSAFVR